MKGIRLGVVTVAATALSGCVQTYWTPPTGLSSQRLVTQDQTAIVEQGDRIARFARLASLQGVVTPQIDQIVLPPGTADNLAGPAPVIRVVFPERAFFAFDSDDPLPQSGPILDVIAYNMRHDVPDAALTVLGHTDAVGSDAYNLDLSRRRAEAVMRGLAERGVNPEQLSQVAIGKRQPIAPNDTQEGRALNRRVEFLISPSIAANLAAVRLRLVPARFFPTGVTLAPAATVYKLKPTGRPGGEILAPVGGVPLDPVIPAGITSAPGGEILAPVDGVPLDPVLPAGLTSAPNAAPAAVAPNLRPATPTPPPMVKPLEPMPVQPLAPGPSVPF